MKVLTLLHQAREYILNTWSASCLRYNSPEQFNADNGNRFIYVAQESGSTPFLKISNKEGYLFNGYFRNMEDFKAILELTSVQKPDDVPKINWQPIATAPMDGTIILGKWEHDEDPRPQVVAYISNTWCISEDRTWHSCATPTHWQPIN